MAAVPPPAPLGRLSATALGLGGVTGAAFVIISRGEFVGALAMLSPRWMVAHNLHFASAALLLFGIVGLYLAHSAGMTVGGHFAFVMALLGTGFYFASGVLTAAVLPMIAGGAPNVVSATGPLFNPPLPVIVISVLLFAFGWMATGFVTARAGIYPAWTGWMIAVGALIGAIPARPFGSAPWILIDIGWVILAIGLVGIAVYGWRDPARARGFAAKPDVSSAA
jgi:hypothetical protein